MNGLSVVIPSKNAMNFLSCAEAVRRNEPEVRIILVDDGMDREWFPRSDLMPIYVIQTGLPFVFSRNVNAGIKFAEPDDIVILNDDAILETPGGLTSLQKAAYDSPEYGIIAATTNNVGNRNQLPKGVGLREEMRMVCFICALIPRYTIDAIGLLDENFVGYGIEDDDYCLRIRRAGMKIGIHDGCFVDHASLPSTFRGSAFNGGNYYPNLEVFKKKWGMDNWGNPA